MKNINQNLISSKHNFRICQKIMVKIYTFLIKLLFIFGLILVYIGLIWFILAKIAAKNIVLMNKKDL